MSDINTTLRELRGRIKEIEEEMAINGSLARNKFAMLERRSSSRVKSLEDALLKIVEQAPASGEDVSFLIAKNALEKGQ